MYTPSKVRGVPELLGKYEGRPEKLWLSLHKKYLTRDPMAETIDSATMEFANLRVSGPEDKVPVPTQEQLEEIRMKK